MGRKIKSQDQLAEKGHRFWWKTVTTQRNGPKPGEIELETEHEQIFLPNYVLICEVETFRIECGRQHSTGRALALDTSETSWKYKQKEAFWRQRWKSGGWTLKSPKQRNQHSITTKVDKKISLWGVKLEFSTLDQNEDQRTSRLTPKRLARTAILTGLDLWQNNSTHSTPLSIDSKYNYLSKACEVEPIELCTRVLTVDLWSLIFNQNFRSKWDRTLDCELGSGREKVRLEANWTTNQPSANPDCLACLLLSKSGVLWKARNAAKPEDPRFGEQ